MLPPQAQSTLSILSPFARAPLGVPFLYQRISSTTPLTALVASKSPTASFSVLHLDGTTDWIVAQRNALLAWTGHTLSLTPRLQRSLSAAHWGSTHLTGRGLVALSSPGQVYTLTLGEGEEFVARPSHVVAYSVTRRPPQPFRFKSSVFKLQVPSLTNLLPDTQFFRVMRTTETYKTVSRLFYGFRTALRRTVWGDRLFLRFSGPATLLVSSRGLSVTEALTRGEVNEVADAPAGVAGAAVGRAMTREEVKEGAVVKDGPVVRTATVGGDGKVSFADEKVLKERLR
ncbi:AIM24 family protein [Candidatus Bathyarchaeota archaeon]|nr:AIM24 family protein [Candidatus Bathyarchaeota archaeon]